MYIWEEPKVTIVVEELSKLDNMLLTIESSLYASGCHFGMGC